MVRPRRQSGAPSSAGRDEMSDIFKEVDEDIRREQLKKLWDRFGIYVLALAAIIVLGTAGWKGWEYWQEQRAQASGDRFLAAVKLSGDGKHDEAIAALQKLTENGSGAYPVMAGFAIAAEKAKAGDKDAAVAEYDKIIADRGTSSEVKSLAKLRAALLLVDTISLSDMEARVGDLATTGNVWRHTAREVLGLTAWRTGDYAAARKYFEQITSDQGAPQDTQRRAQLMLTLITAHLGEPAPATTDAAPAATDAPAQDAAPAN
jgi:hypothetical protein